MQGMLRMHHGATKFISDIPGRSDHDRFRLVDSLLEPVVKLVVVVWEYISRDRVFASSIAVGARVNASHAEGPVGYNWLSRWVMAAK